MPEPQNFIELLNPALTAALDGADEIAIRDITTGKLYRATLSQLGVIGALVNAGSSGAAATLSFLSARVLQVTLTADTTLTLSATGLQAGAEGLIELAQDSTGFRTVTWVNAATNPPISAAANEKTLIGVLYNGSTFVLYTVASGY